MLGNLYKASEIAKNEWRNFALYTITSRAIPHLIDGLKVSQRFYLYSSILDTSKSFERVSSISGPVAKYGYHHGEGSISGAGILMAAPWNNNVLLVEGKGSLGSRLSTQAGAPRYVSTKLHKNFGLFVKDLDLCEKHSDPEHLPPKFYIPVIPLVLANGAAGIATGFATKIEPRHPKDIANACVEYLKTGDIKKRLPISYPQFDGTVVFDEKTRQHTVYGIMKRKGKTIVDVTELPYGVDRETYIQHLDSLEEEGHIIGYDDKCNKQGFGFEIKLKQVTSNLDDAKLFEMLKLSRRLTENLTVIGTKDELLEYTDERDLIKAFVDYRKTVMQKRINLNKKTSEEVVRWSNIKIEFIQGVVDNKISFVGGKQRAQMSAEIKGIISVATDDDVDRLLRMNFMSATLEQIEQLKKEVVQATQDLANWMKATPDGEFLLDLTNLLKEVK